MRDSTHLEGEIAEAVGGRGDEVGHVIDELEGKGVVLRGGKGDEETVGYK